MPLAPYDPASLGPSQSAQIDQTAAQQGVADQNMMADAQQQQARNTAMYTDVSQPKLQSSLGATGQADSSAGGMALRQQNIAFNYGQHDLQSAFERAHTDMLRQQGYAATGLILG